MTSLLPSNSSQLEKDLERVIETSTNLALHIRDLWSAETCPLQLLPWLAWANSVDNWNDLWAEDIKRQVVKNAYEIHRYKGTPFAVKHALEGLNIASQIYEWWEPGGSGQRGTMTVTAMLNENITAEGEGLITPEMLKLVSDTVNAAKRGSIHFETKLGIALEESICLAGALGPACGISDNRFAEVGVLPAAGDLQLNMSAVLQRVDFIDYKLAGQEQHNAS